MSTPADVTIEYRRAICHDCLEARRRIGNRQRHENCPDPQTGQCRGDKVDGVRDQKCDSISLIDTSST